MKLTGTLSILALVILFTMAFRPLTHKAITIIRWTSNQYTDFQTGGEVHMANEFVCSQKSLYWSLFGKELTIADVSWKLDESMNGRITYTVEELDMAMNGTISFDFNKKMAEVNLRSSVGPIHYGLKMDAIQDESK